MRLALLITLVASVACTSNPTPHPSNDADTTGGDLTGGGGFETTSPGGDVGLDPDDFADAMTPTPGLDGDVDGDSEIEDAVDGDEGEVDHDAGDGEDAGPEDAASHAEAD